MLLSLLLINDPFLCEIAHANISAVTVSFFLISRPISDCCPSSQRMEIFWWSTLVVVSFYFFLE